MQKHVLDHPSSVQKSVAPAAIKAERSSLPRRASLTLQRRARDRALSPRLKAFLRIARGIKA